MSFYAWGDYVSVAEKRRQAEKTLAKLRKQGQSVAPVAIEGRKIAKSFWGQSWCTNLERYSDYAYRLPRGRSYVRNGFVVDLQIAKGEVAAMVAGSDLYKIKIAVAPVRTARWKAICRDCAGSIDSLVELLQGRLARGVMDRVCREGDGLFPAPGEIDDGEIGMRLRHAQVNLQQLSTAHRNCARGSLPPRRPLCFQTPAVIPHGVPARVHL